VVSLHPYVEKAAAIDMPGILGTWLPTEDKDGARQDVPNPPWVFSEDAIITVDDKGRLGKMDVNYFKVGNTILLDAVAASPQETEVSVWWAVHVVPVHTLCKVELVGDSLALAPLSYEWLTTQCHEKSLDLSFITVENANNIYTATTAEWQKFLKKHIGDPDLFEQEDPLTFQRLRKANTKIAARTVRE
jgi:hypothetical protein